MSAHTAGATQATQAIFGRWSRTMCAEFARATAGSAHLREALLSAIEDFTRGRAQTDDITIIIMQRA